MSDHYAEARAHGMSETYDRSGTFAAMDRIRDFDRSHPDARWTPRAEELRSEFRVLLIAEAQQHRAQSPGPEEIEGAVERDIRFHLDWTAAYEAHAAKTGKPVGS